MKTDVFSSLFSSCHCFINFTISFLIFWFAIKNYKADDFWLKAQIGERYIELKARADRGNIIIDYSNNGPELDKKYKENPSLIFEPGDTTKENGTGMGMWIIYNTIKDDYNGDILIDTNFKGFKLQLKIPY